MNAIPHVRLAAACAAADQDTERDRERPAKWARYQFLTETRRWPGCGFLTLYSNTGRVALRQPDLGIN